MKDWIRDIVQAVMLTLIVFVVVRQTGGLSSVHHIEQVQQLDRWTATDHARWVTEFEIETQRWRAELIANNPGLKVPEFRNPHTKHVEK